MLLGTNADYVRVRQMKMGLGRFLSEDEDGHGSAEVVLGSTY